MSLGASQDLSRLSIEELAQLSVQSASRRDEALSAAPTAIYVLTGDEILSSAASSIPEALRLAPNLNVQRVDAHQYAISARGFNGIQSSNKLLALVDGRTIYTPLAASVFWELHNRLLEDIQQIEVISGPGGTLYGPNAVNGVISIATRDARDTIGVVARATAGAREQTAALRAGTVLGATGAVRLYGQWFNRDDLPDGIGPDINDRFHGWQAGFRADFEPGASHVTVQGDVFDNQTSAVPGDGNIGHNLLARWTRVMSPASSLRLQAYYDYFERRVLLTRDSVQTFDLEATYDWAIGNHELLIGGGVRTTRDSFVNNLNFFQLQPPRRRLWVYNLFVQDRMALTPELSLIVGLKAEQTSFTGVELLPNVRLAWQPDARTLLWAAVSRAVRTPSRIDRQLVAAGLLAPGTDFDSEKLVAIEAGYRHQSGGAVTFSVSAFYNLYDDIRSTEFSPGAVLPIRLQNGYRGETWGVEAWGTAQLLPWWRLDLGLATLWKDFDLAPGRVDLAQGDSLGDDPNHQLFARSDMNLTDRLDLHLNLRWIGDLDTAPAIDSYVEAEARLAYRLSEAIELYAAGQNLLRRTHAESNDVQRSQLARRSLFLGTRLRF